MRESEHTQLTATLLLRVQVWESKKKNRKFAKILSFAYHGAIIAGEYNEF